MRLLSFIVFLIMLIDSNAQFRIEKSTKVQRDIQSVLSAGSGIKILSVIHKGKNGSFGTFQNGKEVIGLKEGFIISTGFVKDIQQENNSVGTSGKTYNKGIPFLSKLSGVETNDGTEIIVEFKAEHEFISFNFVFGSEEYPEYASSQFNDSYAFTIEGEGYNKERNIALVPNTSHYIGINSINHFINEEYYVSNSTIPGYRRKKDQKIDTTYIQSDDKIYAVITNYNIDNSQLNKATFPIEFDGFTKVMQVGTKVVPGETYKLRILIADGSDRKLDSGVFIEKGSFNSHSDKNFTYGIVGEAGYYFTVDTVFIKDIPPQVEEINDKIISSNAKIRKNNMNYFFESDSWILSKGDIADLKKQISSLADSSILEITIIGYTDDTGSSEYNKRLGLKRARSIQEILIKEGIDKKLITISSIGELPISEESNQKEQRAKNRKVAVLFSFK